VVALADKVEWVTVRPAVLAKEPAGWFSCGLFLFYFSFYRYLIHIVVVE